MITLPTPDFALIIRFAVHGLSGDGVQLAPGLPFCLIQLALFLLGKFLVRDEFFHRLLF